MSRQTDVIFPAWCLACLVCMPLLFMGGMAVLIVYAVLAELADSFFGRNREMTDAREVAQSLCYGNHVRHLA